MGNGCGKSSASAPTTNLAPVSPAASNTGTQEDDLMNTLNGDMKEKILWVFTKYDRDCSGSLDVNEILELMVEIQSVVDDSLVNEVKFTYNDSKVVLKALDADGNGEIDADEFIAWLTKGLAMDGDQFEAYMRSGPTQHQLATFLLGVKLYCELEYKTVDVTPVAVAEEKTAEKEGSNRNMKHRNMRRSAFCLNLSPQMKQRRMQQKIVNGSNRTSVPKMTTFIATIPPNVHPGEQFKAILNGQTALFTCPQGAGPGSKVQLAITNEV